MESVLKTDLMDIEILCVDDASGVSAVKDLLDDYSKRDSRVVPILLKNNGGVCNARNAALEVANGEFVTFVDYDDTVIAEVYGRCLDFFLENADCDICTFGVENAWVDIGLRKVDVFDRSFVTRVDGPELFDAILRDYQSRTLFNYVWNKVYRRSMLEAGRIRFEPHSVCYEDVIFNLDCLMAGAKIGGINLVGYTWTHRSSGSTLGRFRPWIEEGAMMDWERKKKWAEYCGVSERKDVVLALRKVELGIVRQIVFNMYRPNSGQRCFHRIEKIKELMHCCLLRALAVELRMVAFKILRRFCYFSFVRRANLRRLYANIEAIR